MSKSSIKILCVNDEPQLTEFLNDSIFGLGFEVLNASDSYSAIELIKSNSYRIGFIISDFAMPAVDLKLSGFLPKQFQRVRGQKPKNHDSKCSVIK